MFTQNIGTARQISVAATGVALLCFGAVKGHFTGVNKIKSAPQPLLVGGLAAGAAYWLPHLFGWASRSLEDSKKFQEVTRYFLAP